MGGRPGGPGPDPGGPFPFGARGSRNGFPYVHADLRVEGLHFQEVSMRYHRHYFRSADRRFRLTVDSNLQFAAARPTRGAGLAFSPPASMVVLELKFGLSEADAAAPVANAFPFRLARCSKYVLGINCAGGR